MSIHAYAVKHAKGELEKFVYDPGVLGPAEVDVDVSHCGICHSDVHLIDDDWGVSQYPLVPGHEIVGIVKALGSDVRHLKIGDRVGIGWQCGACFACESCREGEENFCDKSRATCVGHFGGYAESVRADGRFVFKIPDNLPSDKAAPLLCGGITVYTPFRFYDVLPKSRVGIVGMGGLGHFAVKFAKALGYDVTVFSTSPGKKNDALHFGANRFVLANDKNQIQNCLGKYHFILSAVSGDLDWAMYFALLAAKGKLCIVGASPKPIEVPAMTLIERQKTLCGSVIGNRRMIEDMLGFCSKHHIGAESENIPMAQVNQAISKVRRNQVRYRAVLVNE